MSRESRIVFSRQENAAQSLRLRVSIVGFSSVCPVRSPQTAFRQWTKYKLGCDISHWHHSYTSLPWNTRTRPLASATERFGQLAISLSELEVSRGTVDVTPGIALSRPSTGENTAFATQPGIVVSKLRVVRNPKHPERVCWGCDKYCSADDLCCGNGTIRTQHPVELFGEDWSDWELNREDSRNPELR